MPLQNSVRQPGVRGVALIAISYVHFLPAGQRDTHNWHHSANLLRFQDSAPVVSDRADQERDTGARGHELTPAVIRFE